MSGFDWLLLGVGVGGILGAGALIGWFLYVFTDGFKNLGP